MGTSIDRNKKFIIHRTYYENSFKNASNKSEKIEVRQEALLHSFFHLHELLKEVKKNINDISELSYQTWAFSRLVLRGKILNVFDTLKTVAVELYGETINLNQTYAAIGLLLEDLKTICSGKPDTEFFNKREEGRRVVDILRRASPEQRVKPTMRKVAENAAGFLINLLEVIKEKRYFEWFEQNKKTLREEILFIKINVDPNLGHNLEQGIENINTIFLLGKKASDILDNKIKQRMLIFESIEAKTWAEKIKIELAKIRNSAMSAIETLSGTLNDQLNAIQNTSLNLANIIQKSFTPSGFYSGIKQILIHPFDSAKNIIGTSRAQPLKAIGLSIAGILVTIVTGGLALPFITAQLGISVADRQRIEYEKKLAIESASKEKDKIMIGKTEKEKEKEKEKTEEMDWETEKNNIAVELEKWMNSFKIKFQNKNNHEDRIEKLRKEELSVDENRGNFTSQEILRHLEHIHASAKNSYTEMKKIGDNAKNQEEISTKIQVELSVESNLNAAALAHVQGNFDSIKRKLPPLPAEGIKEFYLS